MSAQISVIIPVYNSPLGLQTTLDSLVQQKPTNNSFELIVVDNNSTDNTYEIAQSYASQYPEILRVVQELDQQTSYAARNKGISVAKGEILCFIDADMAAPGDYIDGIERYFSSKDVNYLSCNIEPWASSSTIVERYGLACDFHVEDYLKKDHYTVTACLCVRREVFERVGLFDCRLESCGDLEFGQRVYAAGISQTFAHDIVLKHPVRTSYRALIKKQKRIARGNAQLRFYLPARYTTRFWRIAKGYLFYPLPHHTYKRFKSRRIPFSGTEAILLAIFRLPINAASLWELWREYNRLNR